MTPLPSAPPERSVGLWGAVRVGVGAIVGGGVMVLAGTAFARTGPGAILAFAINGLLAFLTAMSFAEMATAFPESGGAYAFAKRVLSVRAAFATGWVVWLAYLVGGVLYALGFAAYFTELLETLWALSGGEPAGVLASRNARLGFALLPMAAYSVQLMRSASGGGEYATYGKLVALGVLVVGGLVAYALHPEVPPGRVLTPFLPFGVGGLFAAMGCTFIALQGFDAIAAVAGEVREPSRNLPRSMFLSLGIALVVYVPLLFVTAAGATTATEQVQHLAARSPDTLMATAAGNLLGPVGYYLVAIAAVLSTLSALHACLLSASRVASSMAADRTLPWVLGLTHPTRGTPAMAIYSSGLAMATLMFMVPDLGAAGAAASLIFLMSFALAHGTALLARLRSAPDAAGRGVYQAPLFPFVPIVGGVGCALLAVYQAVAEPAAGAIALIWLGLGVVLYLSLFAERAQAVDAAAEGRDTELSRLRGRAPLVLVPIRNPANAAALVTLASALTPARLGKVVVLSVVPQDADAAELNLEHSSAILRGALQTAFKTGQRVEALTTVASEPWSEIERVARGVSCERLLVGLSAPDDRDNLRRLERMMSDLDCDLSVLRAPPGWGLSSVRHVLVPVAGRGSHEEVRARLIGSLSRVEGREVHFLQVLPARASLAELQAATRSLTRLAHEEAREAGRAEVVRSDDVTGTILERAAACDLMVLGLRRVDRNRIVVGELALAVTSRGGATILLGSGS